MKPETEKPLYTAKISDNGNNWNVDMSDADLGVGGLLAVTGILFGGIAISCTALYWFFILVGYVFGLENWI